MQPLLARGLSRLSLPTRVGRNILLVFLGCALLPIALLAWLSSRQVSESIDEQARDRLSISARTVAQSISERLSLVGSQLQTRAALFGTFSDSTAVEALLSYPPPGLLEIELDAGAPPGEGGTLTDGQRAVLQAGRPILWMAPGRNHVWMGVKVPGSRAEILWGLIYQAFLWDGGDESNQLLAGAPCVVDDANRAFLCDRPLTGDAFRAMRDARGATFGWVLQDTTMLAAGWSLDLRRSMGASPWHVVVSEPRDILLAQTHRFQKWFFGMGGAAILIVLYLSARLIRRNMAPLSRLQEAIGRIADRDFDHRVEIHSVGQDEFRDLAKSFNGMAEELGRHSRTLTAMNAIDRAVLSSLDRSDIMLAVLERGEALLPGTVLGVCLTRADESPQDWCMAARRRGEHDVFRADFTIGAGELDELSQEQDMLTFDRQADRSFLAPGVLSESIVAYQVFPIRVADHVEGVLLLGFDEASPNDSAHLSRAGQLADRIAVAISNTRLVEALGSLHWGTLTALARAIDAKSPWTAGHSERVTALSVALGHRMGLSEEELDRLHRGGLLHDVGKIGIPAEILDKPEGLTEHERMVMQTHPVIGVRILAPIYAYADVLDVVRHHHERWDGAGYPDKIGGTDIPLLARVLAVADVYDAVTSARPYRPGWSQEQALALVRNGAGSAFDPAIVPVFVKLILEQQAPMDLPAHRASGVLRRALTTPQFAA